MEIKNHRLLTSAEKKLLLLLAEKAGCLQNFIELIDSLKVVPMDDGGMGSLLLLQSSSTSSSTKMGSRASELLFIDEDGIDVIASLNLDECGVPFELDIWKTDFSPLIQIPEEIDSRIKSKNGAKS